MSVDESKFDYTYVPEHLKERVKNWRNLSIGERLILTSELSVAAWAKIGVVHDPSKPEDKTIQKIAPSDWVGEQVSLRPYGAQWFYGLMTQDFILGYFHPLPTGVADERPNAKSYEIPGLKIEALGAWDFRYQ